MVVKYEKVPEKGAVILWLKIPRYSQATLGTFAENESAKMLKELRDFLKPAFTEQALEHVQMTEETKLLPIPKVIDDDVSNNKPSMGLALKLELYGQATAEFLTQYEKFSVAQKKQR